MKELLNLTNKVAIVTGGYGHLGTAMSRGLQAYGAQVIVAGRSLDKFREKFGETEKNISFEQCDISSSESFKKLFTSVHEQYGKIDVVVNNAQFTQGSVAAGISDDDWAATMDGVTGSAFRAIREVIPYMQAQRNGKIINISSMYGMVSPNFSLYEGEACSPNTNPPHYGAAKAALIQLTKYYAALLGPHNIQVNCLTPGPFPKPQVQENKIFLERLQRSNPLNKIGKPEDLVGPLVLLASGGSDFITGQNIVVDGGWTAW